MPTVKTWTTPFDGGDFKVVIKVDGSGVFSAAVPEPVQKTLNIKAVTAKTLRECDQAFRKAIEDYRAATTEIQRVILYGVLSNAAIMDAKGERCVFKSDGISFCEGVAIAVWANVFDEHVITQANGSKGYRYVVVEDNALNKLSISDNNRRSERFTDAPCQYRLVWTPEREHFFVRISRGLEAVILQLDQLKDSQKALAFADSGRLELPAHNTTIT